jgi:hypothetical protein
MASRVAPAVEGMFFFFPTEDEEIPDSAGDWQSGGPHLQNLREKLRQLHHQTQ